MSMRYAASLLTVASWVGCDDPGAIDTTNTAGVVAYQVSETADAVTIVGVDAHDNEIGRIELTVGTFTLSKDFAEGRSAPVDGRRLTINMLGETYTHESEGLGELRLPLPDTHAFAERYRKLGVFARDPRAADVLTRWGVNFRGPATSPRETTYSYSGDICWQLGAPTGVNYCNGNAPFSAATCED